MRISSDVGRHSRSVKGLALMLLLAACGGGDSTQPRMPTGLAYTVQPPTAVAGEPLGTAVVVEIPNGSGVRMGQATDVVTLTLASNPGAGTLAGTTTVNAVGGLGNGTTTSSAVPVGVLGQARAP
jgi:hypothetical protein